MSFRKTVPKWVQKHMTWRKMVWSASMHLRHLEEFLEMIDSMHRPFIWQIDGHGTIMMETSTMKARTESLFTKKDTKQKSQAQNPQQQNKQQNCSMQIFQRIFSLLIIRTMVWMSVLSITLGEQNSMKNSKRIQIIIIFLCFSSMSTKGAFQVFYQENARDEKWYLCILQPYPKSQEEYYRVFQWDLQQHTKSLYSLHGSLSFQGEIFFFWLWKPHPDLQLS